MKYKKLNVCLLLFVLIFFVSSCKPFDDFCNWINEQIRDPRDVIEVSEDGDGLAVKIVREDESFVITLSGRKDKWLYDNESQLGGRSEGSYIVFVPENILKNEKSIVVTNSSNATIIKNVSGSYFTNDIESWPFQCLSIAIGVAKTILLKDPSPIIMGLLGEIAGIDADTEGSRLVTEAINRGGLYKESFYNLFMKTEIFEKQLKKLHEKAKYKNGIVIIPGWNCKIEVQVENPKAVGIDISLQYYQSDLFPRSDEYAPHRSTYMSIYDRLKATTKTIKASLNPHEEYISKKKIRSQVASKKEYKSHIGLKEASLYSGKIELLLPSDYKKKSAESPPEDDELYIFNYTDEKNEVIILITVSIPFEFRIEKAIYSRMPSNLSEDTIPELLRTMSANVFGFDTKWYKNEIININDVDFGVLESSTFISSKQTYKLSCISIFESNKYFSCDIICSAESNIEKWKSTANKILNSIKFITPEVLYKDEFLSTDALGENIIKALKEDNVHYILKFMVNEEDIKELMTTADEEKKNELMAISSELPAYKVKIAKTFSDCKNSGYRNLLDWEFAEFKSTKSHFNFLKNYEYADIYLNFLYEGYSYLIRIDNCLKTNKGWKLGWDGKLSFAGSEKQPYRHFETVPRTQNITDFLDKISNDSLLLQIASTYEKRQLYNTAMECNEYFLEYFPNSRLAPLSQLNIGRLQLGIEGIDNLKRIHNAIESWKQVIIKYPESQYAPHAFEQIFAHYFYFLQDQKSAIVTYKQLIEKYPNSVEAKRALSFLANYHSSQNDFNNAIKACRQLAEKYPNSQETKDVFNTCGFIYYTHIKDYNKALTFYNEFLKRFPNDKTASRVRTTVNEIKRLMRYK